MAVQLARLSLWLTTLASDRPLTFLDHHLATGDSLIGAGLADLARRSSVTSGVAKASRPIARCRSSTADAAVQMAQQSLPERFRLALEPGDTPAPCVRKSARSTRSTLKVQPLAAGSRPPISGARLVLRLERS